MKMCTGSVLRQIQHSGLLLQYLTLDVSPLDVFSCHSWGSILTVQAKTSLAHTSDFTKLIDHKTLQECHIELKLSAVIKWYLFYTSCDIWAVNVFPRESYRPLNWQIWRCELGCFLLGQSHHNKMWLGLTRLASTHIHTKKANFSPSHYSCSHYVTVQVGSYPGGFWCGLFSRPVRCPWVLKWSLKLIYPSPLNEQVAGCKLTHDWLVRLVMDLAALCDAYELKLGHSIPLRHL